MNFPKLIAFEIRILALPNLLSLENQILIAKNPEFDYKILEVFAYSTSPD